MRIDEMRVFYSNLKKNNPHLPDEQHVPMESPLIITVRMGKRAVLNFDVMINLDTEDDEPQDVKPKERWQKDEWPR